MDSVIKHAILTYFLNRQNFLDKRFKAARSVA